MSFGATPAFVQEKDGQIKSGKTIGVSFPTPTSAGNLIVAFVVWDNSGSVSLNDSSGNTYVSMGNPVKWHGNRYSTQIFYAKNIKGGADTVTGTFTSTISSFGTVYVHEYSGLDTVSPFDAAIAATGPSGSLTSGSVATSNASDLLFAAGVSDGSVSSPGGGYVIRSAVHGDMTMDKRVTTAGSYNVTAANSGGAWAMLLAAFKAAATATADTTSPTVPSGLSATPVSTAQINLTWNASSDNVAVAGYQVYRNGVAIGTTVSTNYSDTGLTAGTTYLYTVAAGDAAANLSAPSSGVSATTLSAVPPTISFFGANPTSIYAGQSATLSWTTSNSTSLTIDHNVGIVTGTFSRTVSPSTTTVYVLSATNAAGTTTSQATITVLVDSQAPTVPTNVTPAAISSSQINLTWNASSDNLAVAGYQVYRNGVAIGTATNNNYSDTGLTAGTSYLYTIVAGDAAGNLSAPSTGVSAATLSAATPTISFFGANPTSIYAGQSATLSWTTSNSTSLAIDHNVGVVTGTFSRTVSPSTTTVYVLSATNAAGTTTAQATIMVLVDSQAPTVPTNVTPTAVSSSQINLTWNASSDNLAVAGYQVYRNGTAIGTTAGTNYSDNSLTASTTYTYTVAAVDAAGNLSAQSAGAPETTLAASLGNYSTTYSLTESPLFENGNWKTGKINGLDWADVQTTGGMVCGTQSGTGGYDDSTAILTGTWGPNQSAQATVYTTNQQTGTIYEEVELRLRSVISPHINTGYEVTFRCIQGGGYVQIVRWNGPLGSYAYITNGGNGNYGGIKNGDVVKATITGNLIIAYVNGVEVIRGTDSTFTSGNPGIGFYLQGGNSSLNTTFGFTDFSATDGSAADSQAPSIPANLTANAISPSQINLQWTASTDNVSVAGYQIYRNGQAIGVTTAANYSDVGLAANTTYNYSVAAFDAAGNLSSASTTASAATAGGDSIAPTIPTNVQSLSVTSNTATFTWSASADNIAVAGYRIYRNGSQVGTTTLTSYTDTGLNPLTPYIYTVAAFDTSNNASLQSIQLFVTTVTGPSQPPRFVQANRNQIASGASTTATLSASAQAGNTIVAYVIWSNTGSVSLTDSSGNTFVPAANPVTWASNYRAQVFYATNVKGGTEKVTATYQNAVGAFGVLYICEYAGIDPLTPVDVTASSSGNSTIMTSGTAVTTSPNDLIFGAGVSDNSVTTAGSGFTARDLNYGNITEDRIATATGSYGASATHSGSAWGMQMIAFRPAN